MSRNQVAPGRDLYAAAGFWRRESPPRRYSARAHGIGCIRASIRGDQNGNPRVQWVLATRNALPAHPQMRSRITSDLGMSSSQANRSVALA